MPQPVSPAADEPCPAIPASRIPDHTPATDLDILCFADVEHGVSQEAELDAVAAAWDGFL
jgi:hypothetical protein